ncbi:hypothetical protein ACEUZ9_004120 [Paracoccus litorisediminis]|uniref:hypothetical protein n=1 Tax=Paracoccus litorisediminis TaxID=2006130 RepID=UPI003734AE4E
MTNTTISASKESRPTGSTSGVVSAKSQGLTNEKFVVKPLGRGTWQGPVGEEPEFLEK